MKRIILMIVCITMITSLLTSPVTAAYLDIQDTKFETPVNMLTAFGILDPSDKTDFQPYVNITRGEAAQILVKMMGLTEVMNNTVQKQYFTDVPENHKYAKYINILTEMGLIQTNEEQLFRPDEVITVADACTLLVKATGYDYLANAKGGYPSGYLAVATEKGIINNAVGKLDGNLGRGYFAIMANNALTLDIVSKDGVNGDSSVGSITKGETLLSKKLKIYKVSGQITNIGRSGIYETLKLNKNELTIGKDKYINTVGNIDDYLGYYTEAYYKQDDITGEKSIIYFDFDKQKYDITTILEDDIVSASKDKIIYMDEANETKVVNLNYNFILVYNGSPMATYSDENLWPESGKIQLMDMDNDGTFEIIKVTSYVTYVVRSVSALDEAVYSMDETLDKLDLEKTGDKSVTIIKDGQVTDISKIKKLDVLSVAADKELITPNGRMIDFNNAKVFNIIVTSNSIFGEVTSVGDIGEYTVGDTSLKAAKYFKNTVTETDETTGEVTIKDKVSLGKKATFFLDPFGKVAWVEFSASENGNAGFLLGAMKSSTLSDIIKFKIFTTEGVATTYESTEFVTVYNPYYDGSLESKRVQGEGLLDILTGGDGNITQELIKYAINEDGKIYSISRPTNATVQGYDDINFSLDYVDPIAQFSGSKYRGTLAGRVIWDSDFKSTIFSMGKDGDRYTDKDIKVVSLDFFAKTSSNLQYDIKAYDCDKVGMAQYFVVNQRAVETINEQTSSALIIDRVSTIVDEDGMLCNKIYGYVEGVYKEFLTSAELKKVTPPTTSYQLIYDKYNIKNNVQDLTRGDVILYELDSKGRVKLWQPLFVEAKDNLLANNRLRILQLQATHHKMFRTIACQVVNYSTNYIKIRFIGYGASEPSTFLMGITNKKFMMFDTKKNKLLPCTVADIKTLDMTNNDASSADILFLKFYDYSIGALMVIR